MHFCREFGLIDPTSAEVDYITLNGLQVGAGCTDIQSLGYRLPISFMDTFHFCLFSCLSMAVWKSKSLSEYHVHREAHKGLWHRVFGLHGMRR